MLIFFAFILPTFLSVLVIRYIERQAKTINGASVRRWRRILIPLPIALFLLANLDGVLSLRSYLLTHPDAVPARYSENQAWNTDRFLIAALVSVAILPFLLAAKPTNGLRLILPVWGAHTLWIFFAYAPLLLATGVPLQD